MPICILKDGARGDPRRSKGTRWEAGSLQGAGEVRMWGLALGPHVLNSEELQPRVSWS
jgi:hypothetical protein